MSESDFTDAIATQVKLCFAPDAKGDEKRLDLSAAVRFGDRLYLASDETAGIEILAPQGADWVHQAHIDIGDLVKLPVTTKDKRYEIDIEGLDIDEGGRWLWVTGSHAQKRGNPEGLSGEDGLRSLSKVRFDPNRQFLGRLPLDETGLPVARDGDRRLAHLAFSKTGKLREWLARDPVFAPFLEIPSKDNGLDIEGLAVRGDRIWLGLRGPVLRGCAVVLELEMCVTPTGHLKAKRIDGKRRYRTHLLRLGGDGVRDLCFDGSDLLLLSGTPLDGDGGSAIWRWSDAEHCRVSELQPPERVRNVLDLPYRAVTEKPEGLARWDETQWMIVHDSPDRARAPDGSATYLADLWELTG